MFLSKPVDLADRYGITNRELFYKVYNAELAKHLAARPAADTQTFTSYDVALQLLQKIKHDGQWLEFDTIINAWLRDKPISQQKELLRQLHFDLFSVQVHDIYDTTGLRHLIFKTLVNERAQLQERILKLEWPSSFPLTEEQVERLKVKVKRIESQLPSTPPSNVNIEEQLDLIDKSYADEPNDVKRIRLQSLDRLRLFLSSAVNPPLTPNEKQQQEVLYGQLQKRIEDVIVGMKITHQDVTEMEKVKATLSKPYAEWAALDLTERLDEIATALQITATQTDMIINLTSDKSTWASLGLSLGIAAATLVPYAIYNQYSNGNLGNLSMYLWTIMTTLGTTGVVWVAKFVNRYIRTTTVAEIERLQNNQPQFLDYLKQSQIAGLYKKVGDIVQDNPAAVQYASLAITLMLPTLYRDYVNTVAGGTMTEATAYLTNTLLPLLARSATRSLATWGFQAIRTGVTEKLASVANLSDETKKFLLKWGKSADGLFLVLFMMNDQKAIDFMKRLYGEFSIAQIQELVAAIKSPAMAPGVPILDTTTILDGHTLQETVTQAMEGPSSLFSHMRPEMSPALEQVTTQISSQFIGPQLAQTPVRVLTQDMQRIVAECVINGDQNLVQTFGDEQLKEEASDFSLPSLGLCGWLALGVGAMQTGRQEFQAAGAQSSGIFLLCKYVSSKFYV